MDSSPQGIYVRLKTYMKNAYYTDNMVENLANFRIMASPYLSGPGEYEDLPFLKLCENLEGNGTISWKKLDNLKEIVASASTGKIQLLEMINEAEREIQKSLSDPGCSFRRESGAQKLKVKDPGCPLSRESDAKKRKVKGKDMVIYMRKDAFRVKEYDAAFLECDVFPEPKEVIWKKGEATKVDETIIINNNKYFGAGVSSPTLVIKETEKRDEAYYQCTAKGVGVGIGVTGKAVPLNVDAAEERGNSMHGQSRSHSLAASGTRELHFDRNRKLSPRSQDKHLEPRSWSPEGEQNNKGLTIKILMSNCQMAFTISNHNDIATLSAIIKVAFNAATGEKKRMEELNFERKCIKVSFTIKAANSLSETPAVCLAEQFKHYILNVGLQLSEGSNEVLKVDESSITITAEHMPEDGLPLVNINPQQGSVQHSKSVILQTYIVSSPPASSIEWFRIEADDHKIAIEINSKKYYGGTELSPSLIIRDVNVDDQGWYMCQATNNNGTGCSNKTFVRISSESAREEEEKLGTIVTDVSDTKESARAEDTSETSVFDIKDRQEPAREAEDTSETSVFDIKDRQGRHVYPPYVDPYLDPYQFDPYQFDLDLDLGPLPDQPLQTRVFPESTKRGISDIKEPLQTRSYPESTKRGISDYKEPLQTRAFPESTKRGISDIKDLVPIDVWGRAPSQTEIEKIVTLIDSKFSDLFLELGLPSKTVEEYGLGHPVTFQLRMKALLQCWIDSSQTKATIGRLLTTMKLCQMDWHTAAKIWSAE